MLPAGTPSTSSPSVDQDSAGTGPAGVAPARPLALRAPRIVLAVVLVVGGLVTLPVTALFEVLALASGRAAGMALLFGLPLLGYPLTGVLCHRLRRVRTAALAWGLVALGVAVLVAVSYVPVSTFAHAFYAEWQETQPGGRGYRG